MAQFANTRPSKSTLIIPVIVACILQLVLAPQISILGGRFNFMAAAVCALAPGLQPTTAVFLGFGLGLFYDLTSSVPVGLMALLLTLTSFALSYASSSHSLGLSLEGIRLSVVAIILVMVLYGLANFFMGLDTSFVDAVIVRGLSSALLSALACLPFLAFSPRDSSRTFSRGGRGRGTRAQGIR